VKQEIGFVALLESTGVQVADRADELAFVNVPELLQWQGGAVAIVGKGTGARHDAVCQVPPKSGEGGRYGS
jgi:hypothetical protein